MSAKTLADACDQHASDTIKPGAPQELVTLARHSFFCGALATMEALKAGASRDALLQELLAYGRAIGAATERAQA